MILSIAAITMSLFFIKCDIKDEQIVQSSVKSKIDYLEKVSSDNIYAMYFDAYFSDNGQYPKNIEDLKKYVLRTGQPFSYDGKLFKDPFTGENLVYYVLKKNSKNVDYLLYSLGKDKKDNNEISIGLFNQGKINKIIFKTFNTRDIENSFLGDIPVHIPQSKNQIECTFEIVK